MIKAGGGAGDQGCLAIKAGGGAVDHGWWRGRRSRLVAGLGFGRGVGSVGVRSGPWTCAPLDCAPLGASGPHRSPSLLLNQPFVVLLPTLDHVGVGVQVRVDEADAAPVGLVAVAAEQEADAHSSLPPRHSPARTTMRGERARKWPKSESVRPPTLLPITPA